MNRFEDRVAIVTGGGEGIGRAICERLISEGAKVGIIEVNPELAEKTPAELGNGTVGAVADISDEPAVEAAIAELTKALGGPTVLVNNAATFIFKGLEATTEDWRRVTEVNVMGPALVSKHLVPHMEGAGGGAIVNIGSVSGKIAQPGLLTYNATKGAVLEMSRCMALDLHPSGIRVNSVSPGTVWSASVERVCAAENWSREDAFAGKLPMLGLETILKRPAEVHEIAAAVAFLCSDDASYITGANLMVDGGQTAL
jgi:NAD(P)-dependent dehydrogenase (short-subunit alcohol dehydrogenase family)